MILEQIKKQLEPFNPEYCEEIDDSDVKNGWLSIDFPDFENLTLSYDTSLENSTKKNKGEIAFSYYHKETEEAFYGVYKGKDIGHFVKMIIDYYTGLGR